jgi:hypothetical protein
LSISLSFFVEAMPARYREAVDPRSRFMAFGSAAGVVVAGAIFGLFVGGFTGELLAIAFVTVGLGAALLLLFLEVGLSEDHEREMEEERKRKRGARRAHPQRRLRQPQRPRRPG